MCRAVSILLLMLISVNGFAGHPLADRIPSSTHDWNDREKRILRSLSLFSLGDPPPNPSNKYAESAQAASLGKKIFFDTRFSSNNAVACATCHNPDTNFTDTLPKARGVGEVPRRSMPLLGMAYLNWYFWDGRKDSLWSQALGPLESPLEHGISRTWVVNLVKQFYPEDYEALFGPLPEAVKAKLPGSARPAGIGTQQQQLWDALLPKQREEINRVFSNIGKAIEAYVRTIRLRPSRFDKYAKAVQENDQRNLNRMMTPEQIAGLRIFIGKGFCTNCHNGPMLTNGHFHPVGTPDLDEARKDAGRAAVLESLQRDEFNCLGIYSDAGEDDCAELRFMDTNKKAYQQAFKTPTLRNVAVQSHFMHAGQFSKLSDVLKHYRNTSQTGSVNADLEHGILTDTELTQLERFLESLISPVLAP